MARHLSQPKKTGLPAPAIDPSGEFTSGETYPDFAGFKKVIRETRQDLFLRHLIREILSYSTGRLMEPPDSFVIEDILAKVKKDNLGCQTLLVECLTSEVFRSR
jgi:hypothetical protein